MLRFSQAIVATVMASTFLFACGDKINPQGDQPTDSAVVTGVDGGGENTGPVTYTQTIKPFLAKYCTGCHSPSLGISPALDTYSDAKAHAADCAGAMQTTMPPSPPKPTDAEKQAFQDWITQGTPQ
jgi:hypothetical protein